MTYKVGYHLRCLPWFLHLFTNCCFVYVIGSFGILSICVGKECQMTFFFVYIYIDIYALCVLGFIQRIIVLVYYHLSMLGFC